MNDHLHALPAGHLLGEYRIEHVIGSGGFGITYYAWDIHLDMPVAVKEYLPNEFALRVDALTVKPKSTSDAGDYQWGLERFLDEARALARFRHPHINEVHRFFEANGTAYIVLNYIEGETLAQLLRRTKRLEAPRLRRLLDELLSGLDEVHRAGFVHRDIKPGNIMFREDGAAVLLDFGAARQAIGQRSKSITSILTPGYAPIEQYDQQADDVGPWTDLYALGMVAYRCISGVDDGALPDSVARARLERKGEQDKGLAPAVAVGKGRYDQSLLKAVDWAIRVDEESRPQSVAALREVLAGGVAAEAPLRRESYAKKPSESKQVKAGKRKPGIVVAVVLAFGMVAAAAVGWPFAQEWMDWRAVRCADAEQVRSYLNAYPGGIYAEEANECMEAEKQRQKAEAEKQRREAEAEKQRQKAEAEKQRQKAEAEKQRREAEAKNAPGTLFRDCAACPEMRIVAAGSYVMGSPSYEGGRDEDEGPRHLVTIAKPFAVGKYAVTHGEFAHFVLETGYTMPRGCYVQKDGSWANNTNISWLDPGFRQTNQHPVVCVTWNDAQHYVAWLSDTTGESYRLLSESEWEYVARGGAKSKGYRYAGSNEVGEVGWHDGNSGGGTHPVGRKKGNELGLYDLSGNVYEWVEDCWNDSYAGAPTDGRAWRHGECDKRVARGGSWISQPRNLRAAYRVRSNTGNRSYNLGFRVARTLTP